MEPAFVWCRLMLGLAVTAACQGATLWSSGTVIGHGIGGKDIPIMARLAKGQTLE